MKTTLLAAMISVASGSALAIDQLNVFQKDQPATAESVNANFKYLEDKIGASSESIDCTSTPQALREYMLNAKFAGDLTVNVIGECAGPVQIFKDDVTINGGTVFIEQNAPASFAILNQSNITLQGVTIQSGSVRIAREASVEFKNVTLPEPKSTTDHDDDPDILPNVIVESSTLSFESGDLNNLSLLARANTSIVLKSGLANPAEKIELVDNSSLISEHTPLKIERDLSVFNNSSMTAGAIEAKGEIDLETSSSLVADKLTTESALEVENGSSIEVVNDDETAVTAKSFECGSSSMAIEGGIKLTGQMNWNGNNPPAWFARSCSGELDGDYEGGIINAERSPVRIQRTDNGQYQELWLDQDSI
ncbi:hypothetical protein [Endozoicomonas sp. OPT23]|uniref:hypothetical protein n=1 Tax=Endozoicomonas sp. OPT23 TaxID=2072845 RepID=UPI00129C09EA|nr:hypothetical protein [Endozoicomonas sp. OPT23]